MCLHFIVLNNEWNARLLFKLLTASFHLENNISDIKLCSYPLNFKDDYLSIQFAEKRQTLKLQIVFPSSNEARPFCWSSFYHFLMENNFIDFKNKEIKTFPTWLVYFLKILNLIITYYIDNVIKCYYASLEFLFIKYLSSLVHKQLVIEIYGNFMEWNDKC